MNKEEQAKFKADTRNLIDVTLLVICVTLFGLVATIKPDILSDNPLFTLQLVLAIPFFVCGLLSRIKDAAYGNFSRWKSLSFVSFTLAYGFFINSTGLLLSFVTPLYVVLTFFVVNTLLTLVRAGIVVSYSPNKLKSRVFREIVHILLVVLLGILPALKVF